MGGEYFIADVVENILGLKYIFIVKSIFDTLYLKSLPPQIIREYFCMINFLNKMQIRARHYIDSIVTQLMIQRVEMTTHIFTYST